MKRIACAILVLSLTCSTNLLAQERGSWRAASKTAQSITGDISISTDKLSINFVAFPIAQIRPLNPAEIKAAFDLDANPTGTGSLYKLNIPGDKKFLHKNALCGGEATQWMVAYATGHSLQVAFFSGDPMPVFTPEAIATTTSLCGTYSYLK
jgi:hypothetical protein